jgi:hypothetical protein
MNIKTAVVTYGASIFDRRHAESQSCIEKAILLNQRL